MNASHAVHHTIQSQESRYSDDRTAIQEMVTSVCRFVGYEYSRFPEVEIVKSLSAQSVIPIFDKVSSSRDPYTRKLED